MKLQQVRIGKNDSCLTYVLKRLGIYDTFKYRHARELSDTFYEPYDLGVTEFEVGQILAWESRKEYYLWDTEIATLPDGRPFLIKNNEYAGMHFGIVEHIEDASPDHNPIVTISDCVRSNNASSFPTICLATICFDDLAKSKTEVRLPSYVMNIFNNNLIQHGI